MPIIELPREVVDKIAAGEVVERPSSVVKELVENSLDAGAALIEVEVRNGGLDLIRVSDDGRGMPRNDLLMSVRPHATSKINSYQDILEAYSYGFRGEALPSIASVSRLKITSRAAGHDTGWELACGAGREHREREAAAATGTTVEVEALFGNVPARRKFLRSAMTESRRCLEEVYHQALANHGVGFRFVNDGRMALDLPAAGAAERWRQALGRELFQTMVPLDTSSGDLSVAGLSSKPGSLWPRRREQNIYVNGRRVVHRLVQSAAYQAYGPALEGRHPAFLLFLAMPARYVDVNVHPAKREVRFRDNELVFRFVRSSMEKAVFGKGDGPREALSFPQRMPAGGGPQGRTWPDLSVAERQSVFELASAGSETSGPQSNLAGPPPVAQCWQLHDRYIIAPIRNGMILVDQHAAHERILYEELLGRSGGARPQQMMFPAAVELTASEMLVLAEHRCVFESLGFDLKEFGGRTIVIEGLPSSTAEADAEAVVRGILGDLGDTRQAGSDPRERVARSFACRAAIKAGRPLSQEEMNRLIDRLFATASPYLDPHGRPAVIKLSLEDLERRFGRV
jgi:DNA mismatch repair protein MutL